MTQLVAQPYQTEAAGLSGMSVVPAAGGGDAVPVSPTLSDQEVLDLTMTDFMSYLLEGKADVPPSPHHTSDGNGIPPPDMYNLVPLVMSPPLQTAHHVSADPVTALAAALVESSEEDERGSVSSRGASPSDATSSPRQPETTRTARRSAAARGGRSQRRGGAEPNRNARMAKENRERKKAYVTDLEQQLAATQQEKADVVAEKTDLQAELAEARAEIAQLRQSLAAAPAIAQVMKALGAASSHLSFDGPPPARTAGRKRAAHEDNGQDDAAEPALGRGKRRASAARKAAKPAREVTPQPTIIPLQLNLHVHAQ